MKFKANIIFSNKESELYINKAINNIRCEQFYKYVETLNLNEVQMESLNKLIHNGIDESKTIANVS